MQPKYKVVNPQQKLLALLIPIGQHTFVLIYDVTVLMLNLRLLTAHVLSASSEPERYEDMPSLRLLTFVSTSLSLVIHNTP
jgi:hypothetical protein